MARTPGPERTIMNLRRLFRRTPKKPPPLFVTGIAAGMAHGASCGIHGEDSFALDLTGTYHPGTPDTTNILLVMSHCEAADAFGVLAALARHYNGPDSSKAFMNQAKASYLRAHHHMQQLAAAGLLCCDAGRATRGREHTCDQDGADL